MGLSTKTKHIAACIFLSAYSFILFGSFLHQHKNSGKQEYSKEESFSPKCNNSSCDFCEYIFNQYITKAVPLQLSHIYVHFCKDRSSIYDDPNYRLELFFFAKDRAPPTISYTV